MLNFANPDMVGHTGSLSAAIAAVETVDTGLGPHRQRDRGPGRGLAGNRRSRQLRIDERPRTGGPHTAHTTNKVPALLMGGGIDMLHEGRLADIAPTLLTLMGLRPSREMTGQPLMGPA